MMALAVCVMGVCLACAGAKRALLVGISHYPKHADATLTWPSIHGANDVALLKPTLRAQGFTVATLTNFQATAACIRSSLKALAAESRAGDLVYIHFSGHGQAYEDLSGDEDDGWDEAIVPYDAMARYRKGVYEGKNHIIDDELFVRGTDHGFSPHGKTYAPKIDRRGNMRVRKQPGLGGVCILEACRAYQTNTEIRQGGKYYGALSYYVNLALQKTTLTADTRWVETVRGMMNKDKRLIKQNMVVEKTD